MSEKKLDFIGIGTIRGASTWLHECLNEHPSLCLSDPKETHYFLKPDDTPLRNFYLHCGDDQLRGEFDPSYLSQPIAIDRIHDAFPNIKLIVGLRNPAERAHSHFLKHFVKGKQQASSFAEVVKNKTDTYLVPGLYHKHLTYVYTKFSPQQIHYVFYEDIKTKPIATIQNIYAFLGVDANFSPGKAVERTNQYGSRLAKSAYLNQIIYGFERSASRILPTSIKRLARRWKLSKALYKLKSYNMTSTKTISTPKPQIENDLYNQLIDYYTADIEALEIMLHKDLSDWKKKK